MASTTVFNYRSVLLTLLASPTETIFDSLLQALEDYHARPLTTLREVKDRDSKKAKGTAWEVFCKDWLLASGKYEQVWLLSETPLDTLQALQLTNAFGKVTKMDNGIDLIALSSQGYSAIQCKYRSGNKRVNWASLATFEGLCAKSGPWVQQLVMTNAKGVTHKVKRGPKDRSICYLSFAHSEREVWLKMCGEYVEHKLVEEKVRKLSVAQLREQRCTTLNNANNANNVSNTTHSAEVPVSNNPSLEELRAARLARFNAPLKPC